VGLAHFRFGAIRAACYERRMFNEILMGKETLEPPPEPVSPYRVQSIPETASATCVDCQSAFTTKTSANSVRCPACRGAMVQRNEAESARIYAEAEAQAAASQRSMRRFKWAGFAVLSVTLGLIKGQMRQEIADDQAAQAAASLPYYSSYSDAYSTDLHYLANDACACKDLKCARDVQARVAQMLERSTGPSDDVADEQGRKSLELIGQCLVQFE
jgi:hypothetical protein